MSDAGLKGWRWFQAPNVVLQAPNLQTSKLGASIWPSMASLFVAWTASCTAVRVPRFLPRSATNFRIQILPNLVAYRYEASGGPSRTAMGPQGAQ
ncbi:hypothetical protein E3N88_14133 [Mikania micrantha]|uniref:Uncharacterized protein n=1 Tax=Mikania micrantha TaxID=192012 RepID=A0A5N6P2M1_9ASTR|nr:hypothetical protein E3N88_14133 [Mikania micrantha]